MYISRDFDHQSISIRNHVIFLRPRTSSTVVRYIRWFLITCCILHIFWCLMKVNIIMLEISLIITSYIIVFRYDISQGLHDLCMAFRNNTISQYQWNSGVFWCVAFSWCIWNFSQCKQKIDRCVISHQNMEDNIKCAWDLLGNVGWMQFVDAIGRNIFTN